MSVGGEPSALLAEFPSEEALAEAIANTRKRGYRWIDAFSPLPSEKLAQTIGETSWRVEHLAFAVGVCGAAAIFIMVVYSSIIHYPFIVGGKPFYSWPPFVVLVFAFGVLSAVLGATISMIAINRLPRFHHPLFNVQNFTAASRDGYFLAIAANDPQFDAAAVRRLLDDQHAVRVMEVPQ